MREKLRDQGRLHHILQAIDNISAFMEDKSAEDFLSNQMLYFAIIKNLEIIGEASYMLTHEFTESHPATSWKDIIRMRHILVHGYYQVDSRIIWKTIMEDLPLLKEQISGYLEEQQLTKD